MNPIGMEPADRAAFEQAVALLGPAGLDVLRSFVDPAVWDQLADCSPAADDSLGWLWPLVDESGLRQAGAQELAGLRRWLGRLERRRIDPILAPHLGQVGWWRARTCRPDSFCLRSLQAALLGRGPASLDLGLRAGLHHLARCLADRPPDSLATGLEGLPADWAGSLRACQARLASSARARMQANRLLGQWRSGRRR